MRTPLRVPEHVWAKLDATAVGSRTVALRSSIPVNSPPSNANGPRYFGVIG
jgi:hypothetical protein